MFQDCCGSCPVPTTEEEKNIAAEESRTFVSGPLNFLTDQPGRQEIGSFNPVTDDKWTTMSYVGSSVDLDLEIVDGYLDHVQNWRPEGVNPNRVKFVKDCCRRLINKILFY